MHGDPMKISILVDDRAGEGLEAEHGLSILLETDGRRILFDTGPGAVVRRNAEKLGVELDTVDTIILSHGHYDHTGGIPFVTRGRADVDLYFHPGASIPRWSIDARGARTVGMPEEALNAVRAMPGERVHPVLDTTYVADRVGVVAPIRRTTRFEDAGGPFFLDSEAAAPDPIEDDLAMWIETPGGVLLIVGCCHAGIVNTLKHVTALTGTQQVNAVIGGLHLLHAGEQRLQRTLQSLPKLVNLSSEPAMILCHCTGDRAISELQSAFGNTVAVAGSGAVVRLPQRPGGGVFFSPAGIE